MFVYVLPDELRPEVTYYALHHCAPGRYVIRSGRGGKVVMIGLRDEDRAHLFLNLFDDTIEASFEVAPGPGDDRGWSDGMRARQSAA